jgi:hypothetical protein
MQKGRQKDLAARTEEKVLYNSILHACVLTQVYMASEFKMKHILLVGDYH